MLSNMPNPTDIDLADPVFNAIWNVAKTWDVNVPEHYQGYCGMNGSHVMMILNAIRAIEQAVRFERGNRGGNTNLIEVLGAKVPEITVHFYDRYNTTFYFLPHEAEAGLKRLEQWYLETKAQCDDYIKKTRKEELLRELEKLS